jgi:hypothetical protein
VSDLAHSAEIKHSERQNEHAKDRGAISFSGSSATKQSLSFKIDRENMKTVEKHFKSDRVTKLLEELHSFDDNFQARIQKKVEPHSLCQTEARNLRKRKRSGSDNTLEATNLLPVISDSGPLGYAEITFPSFRKLVDLVHEVLGSNLPAYYLDIGSGTTAHCVITASASGRFLVCDGIEISSTRFQKSQQSLLAAKKLGFLKSECRIIEGDVITSKDIQLQEYNVYSFFDKVCIDVSQKAIQKVIMQHSSNSFARGPIMYFTCMTSSQLKDALKEVQTILDPKAWSRLLIDDSESIIASTRFASQHFKCTMVHVREREWVEDDALGIGVRITEQQRPNKERENAAAQAFVLHSMERRVIEKETLRATADSLVQTEESELLKVCGESSAFQGLHGAKRCWTSTKEAVTAKCTGIIRQSPCIGKSEFSTLVFTSLLDAIKVWEDAVDAKARKDLPEFNILATVCKWSEPKKTKGVNS